MGALFLKIKIKCQPKREINKYMKTFRWPWSFGPRLKKLNEPVKFFCEYQTNGRVTFFEVKLGTTIMTPKKWWLWLHKRKDYFLCSYSKSKCAFRLKKRERENKKYIDTGKYGSKIWIISKIYEIISKNKKLAINEMNLKLFLNHNFFIIFKTGIFSGNPTWTRPENLKFSGYPTRIWPENPIFSGFLKIFSLDFFY
jgi:hypothetical protein